MKKIISLCVLLSVTQALSVYAQDSYTITVTDKGIEPQTIDIPAGQKVPLIVKNLTSEPVELEGKAFASEIVAPPQGQAKEYVGPYSAGEYGFYNDYNRKEVGVVRSH